MRCLKVIAALLMLLALNTAVCFALEEETTDNYSSFYESSGADSLDDSLPDDVKDTIDSAGIDISNWKSMLSPSPKKIISMFADIARGSFKKPIKDMVIIAGVVVLVGLIKGTAAAENFSEPLNIVIGCAVAITVFASSAGVISQGMSAVETTSDFMLALIPVLAGIITAAGNPTLALTYGSFAMAAAQAAAQTAGNIIMPLCGAFSAFGVSASLSPELKLIKLADMIKKTHYRRSVICCGGVFGCSWAQKSSRRERGHLGFKGHKACAQLRSADSRRRAQRRLFVDNRQRISAQKYGRRVRRYRRCDDRPARRSSVDGKNYFVEAPRRALFVHGGRHNRRSARHSLVRADRDKRGGYFYSSSLYYLNGDSHLRESGCVAWRN